MDPKNDAHVRVRGLCNAFKSGNYEYALTEESKLVVQIIGNRNNILQSSEQDYFGKGILYSRAGGAMENETRISKAWVSLFDLNKLNVSLATISRFDRELSNIIDSENSKPLWYELNFIEEQKKSKLSEFRVGSHDYSIKRFNSMLLETESHRSQDDSSGSRSGSASKIQRKSKLNVASDITTVRRLPMLEGKDDSAVDTKFMIRNDLNSKGVKEISKSLYIGERIKNDLNPHFTVNPIDALYAALAYFKAGSPTQDCFSYGVRYLELVSLRSAKVNGFPVYPVTISSDGELVALHGYSHSCDKLRYILNQLVYLVSHSELHRYTENYLEVQREFLFAHLTNPHASIFLKKTLGPIFLYFGHKTDSIKQGRDVHCHPNYTGLDFDTISPNDRQFFRQSSTCDSCMVTLRDKIILDSVFKMVRKELYDVIDNLRKNEVFPLLATAEFVKSKLLNFVPNYHIIHDVTFLMSSNNMSGYSRSNKMYDFLSTIDPMIEKNREYTSSKKFVEHMMPQGDRLMSQAKGATLRMMTDGGYPSGSNFRANLSSNLTSRSAGIGPINIKITVNDKSYKSSTTSKLGHVAAKGSQILDVEKPLIKARDPSEQIVRLNMSNEEWDLLPESRKIYLCGLYSIGTRSVAGGRPERPVYMQPVTKHLMQASFMGPVIKSSLSLYAPNSGKFFCDNTGLGSGFSTKHNRYGIDSVSHAVMASSSGRFLLLQADSSNWDQNLMQTLLKYVYLGMNSALHSRKAYFQQIINNKLENVPYMYFGPTALTPVEISSMYAEAQGVSLYVARAYQGAVIFNVDFMESGRLDTFFCNTLQNLDIMEQVSRKLNNMNSRILYVQAAGDDITTVFTLPDVVDKKVLENIRKAVSDTYEDHNHVMNVFKTVLSPISGEYTKIHFYMGMLFREPSIQPMESEKTDNAETFIEKSRGLIQKFYEYSKRASGDAVVNASLFRVLGALSYHTDIPISRSNSMFKRWYLPYLGVLTPTAILGGLGASISGFKLNEVTTFDYIFENRYNHTLGVLNKIKFNRKDLISREILATVTSMAKGTSKIGKGGKTQSTSVEIEDSLNDGVKLSFSEGYNYFINSQDPSMIKTSTEAAKYLKANNISFDSKLGYVNAPYELMRNAVETFKTPGTVNLSDTMDILNMINDVESAPAVSLRDIYKLHFIVDIVVASHGDLLMEPIQNHHVFVTAPEQSRLCETIFGSRNGSGQVNFSNGGNRYISEFISRTKSYHVDEEVLVNNLSSIVINSFATKPVEAISKFLSYVSGDKATSDQIAPQLLKDMAYWNDLKVSSGIAGTLAEFMDYNVNTISIKYMDIRLVAPLGPVLNLVKAMAIDTMVSRLYMNGFKRSTVKIIENAHTSLIADSIRMYGVTKRVHRIVDKDKKMFIEVLKTGTLRDFNPLGEMARTPLYKQYQTDDNLTSA